MSDDFLIEVEDSDPICPRCGSGDLTTELTGKPMRCRSCGWRGWSREEDEDD